MYCVESMVFKLIVYLILILAVDETKCLCCEILGLQNFVQVSGSEFCYIIMVTAMSFALPL